MHMYVWIYTGVYLNICIYSYYGTVIIVDSMMRPVTGRRHQPAGVEIYIYIYIYMYI